MYASLNAYAFADCAMKKKKKAAKFGLWGYKYVAKQTKTGEDTKDGYGYQVNKSPYDF